MIAQKKTLVGLSVVGVLLVAFAAWAAGNIETANQGAPGTQGPWPVTCSNCSGGGGSGDGGANSTVYNLPALCTATSPYAVTTTSATAGAVPASAAAGRSYIVVTLTAGTVNPSTATVKCATNGAAVTLAATSPGDVLQYGDSTTYAAASTNVINCVGDAGYVVTSFECVPQP